MNKNIPIFYIKDQKSITESQKKVKTEVIQENKKILNGLVLR